MKLEDQLEATNKEVEALQARISAYSKTSPAGMILHKWDETLSIWRKLQKEAEDMREELVEDKYLTVYRTVSRQAEDMMQSLEKIFSQCNAFVHVSSHSLLDQAESHRNMLFLAGNIQELRLTYQGQWRRATKSD